MDSTLDSLFDSVKFDDEDMEGYEHQFGGKFITFNSSRIFYKFRITQTKI